MFSCEICKILMENLTEVHLRRLLQHNTEKRKPKLGLRFLPWVLHTRLEKSPKYASTSTYLTLSWQRSLSYRNQAIHLLCKSMNWFLHDRDLRHGYFHVTFPNARVDQYTIYFYRKNCFECDRRNLQKKLAVVRF